VTPRLTLTDAPGREAERVIESGLADYNEEQAGFKDSSGLAVLISDPDTEQVVGGLLGRTSLGLFFVDLFFIPAALRGQDLGSRALGMAEDEARRRGCVASVLYTISFQAPEFYERLGYRRFGEIACLPAGTSRVFLSKPL